jgi:terminal uridylyltransferase
VITHYINGIRDPKIQEALQAKTSSNELSSLYSLALQHIVLQLADDYEIALSNNHYGEQDRVDIEQYITFLRSRAIGHTNPSLNSGQVASFQMDLPDPQFVAKLRDLPDPRKALHKPRDRYRDHLEFPKNGIGIQCDINFSTQLGIHNTLLLRCYAMTDSRVRPMVLFIKYWARVRTINSPYRGTLSSYGWVLMVLHYLINVATPFVCPNLQMIRRDPPPYLTPEEIKIQTTCNGYDVRFWRDEREIATLAERGMLNQNNDSIGKLLRGFFEYYAHSGQLSTGGMGFDWMHHVLSLRTNGGIITKPEKGWTTVRTQMETSTEAAPASTPTLKLPSPENSALASPNIPMDTAPQLVKKEEVKEIRHHYLVAIEDPFETDHNVGRTVRHHGIIAIRNEFRRAWRILLAVGRKEVPECDLLDEVVAGAEAKSEFHELMDMIHGKAEYNKTKPL